MHRELENQEEIEFKNSDVPKKYGNEGKENEGSELLCFGTDSLDVWGP